MPLPFQVFSALAFCRIHLLHAHVRASICSLCTQVLWGTQFTLVDAMRSRGTSASATQVRGSILQLLVYGVYPRCDARDTARDVGKHSFWHLGAVIPHALLSITAFCYPTPMQHTALSRDLWCVYRPITCGLRYPLSLLRLRASKRDSKPVVGARAPLLS